MLVPRTERPVVLPGAGPRERKICCQPHRLRADVKVLNFFSAHADEPTFVDLIGRQDRERNQTLAVALAADGWGDGVIPERGETFAA